MSTDTERLPELEQRRLMVQDRIRHVAADVKARLAEGLPKFVEREMKRGFVENPDFASRLGDAAVRDLKLAVGSESDRGRDQVLAALEDDSLWFPPTTETSRTTMADNAALWSVVSGIVHTVHELRERFGYPPGGEPVEYRPPTWFIGRRYLPTLSEKYWRLLAELAEIDGKMRALRQETSKAELSKRWDAV